MKLTFSVIVIFLSFEAVTAQDFRLSNMLFNNYEKYKVDELQYRRFSYEDISPLIDELKTDSLFEVKKLGTSIEGRPINLIRLGNGDTKVLLWSQMHGDESTATMALFDIFKFFKEENDSFSYTRKRLMRKLSIYFIPMLNPDGAQIFSRYNALGIDINRDALRLTSPESQILKSVRDSLNPQFGFNLHDQSIYYSAGDVSSPATISFLAPAYDYEQSENEVRTRAMKLIAYLNPMLQQHIPDGVAKYSDAHEPRAFGDNIQKWGTSTILIESGGYPDDPEKQYIRKLNFNILLTAFDAIAENRFSDTNTESYYEIPENQSSLTDLVIRNAIYQYEGKDYKIDLAIRLQQRYLNDSLSYSTSIISEIGDLSTRYGYEEIDVNEMTVAAGKVYPDTLQNLQQALDLNAKDLLASGFTDVIVREAPSSPFVTNFPLNITTDSANGNKVGLWITPNLIFTEGDRVRYVVVNGFLYDVEKENLDAIQNTLVEE